MVIMLSPVLLGKQGHISVGSEEKETYPSAANRSFFSFLLLRSTLKNLTYLPNSKPAARETRAHTAP